MRWSLTTSFFLHAAILVGALVVLPNPKEFVVAPTKAIQVDISNISDTTKLMASAKSETPTEKPKPKKVDAPKTDAKPAPKVDDKVKKAVTEAKPEPKSEPKPEPKKDEPKPEELKDLIKDTLAETPEPKKEEPKKEEPKKAEVKPKEKPKKPAKPKPKLDTDSIAAFLNKTDDQSSPETQSEGDKTASNTANTQGSDSELSATIIDAFAQKMRECWTVPPGAREAHIIPEVHFMLNEDGSVNGVPEIMNPTPDPLFDVTARSAVAAIMDCQPYDFLPKDRYDLWKDNTFGFDPNMMTNS